MTGKGSFRQGLPFFIHSNPAVTGKQQVHT